MSQTAEKRIEFIVGTHISHAAQQLVDAAQPHGAASGAFNDIPLTADSNTTADQIVALFEAEQAARAEAYRNSPEGIAAERAADARRADAQQKHDALMRQLPSLDFSNDVAVLDWCCAMQEPSDHTGVIVRRKSIVETFGRHGFYPGVNCDSDYRPESRDNTFRYLVGQALSGLDTGPSIHPIVHKFAAGWKEKFVAKATEPQP